MPLPARNSRLRSNTSLIFCASLLTAPLSSQGNETPQLEVEDKVARKGEQIEFVMVPRDPEGVVPGVYLADGPVDAELKDNGDGTRTFSWLPAEAGTFNLHIVVQDGQNDQLTNSYVSKITVVDAVEPVTGSVGVELNHDLSSSSIQGFNAEVQISDQPGGVRKVLEDVPVSSAQANAQQTSIDTEHGYLYTVNIEPGPSGDVAGDDLLTVLRQGRQKTDSTWEWQSVVIDDRTVHNRWHTAPSVAVDRSGGIHVVYNMHNIPWQYKRSNTPHNIYDFKFEGQSISDQELRDAWQHKKLNFPTLGTAGIPGNQITYPAFFKDHNRELFISYRFAAAPLRKFDDRLISSGIGLYNEQTAQWSAIGSTIEHHSGDFLPAPNAPDSAVAFAGKRGWTSYMPRLAFDSSNQLFVSSMWREGIAGSVLRKPCVVKMYDRKIVTELSGEWVDMPLSPDACGNVGVSDQESFYNTGSFALSRDNVPHLLLSPKDGSRLIKRYNFNTNVWDSERAPNGSTELFFDNENNQYAISSGIRIYKRAAVDKPWETIYDEGHKNNCYPKVKKNQSGKVAFIHALSCDSKRVTVYGLQLP